MADRLGTLDSVLTGLAAAGPVNRATPRAAAAASSENPDMTTIATIAALTAAYPDLVAQIRQEALAGASSTATEAALAAARAEGGTAERERILGIEAALIPGHDALVAQFKADGKTTPARRRSRSTRPSASCARRQLKATWRPTARPARPPPRARRRRRRRRPPSSCSPTRPAGRGALQGGLRGRRQDPRDARHARRFTAYQTAPRERAASARLRAKEGAHRRAGRSARLFSPRFAFLFPWRTSMTTLAVDKPRTGEGGCIQ
jgi:hypothetical protein